VTLSHVLSPVTETWFGDAFPSRRRLDCVVTLPKGSLGYSMNIVWKRLPRDARIEFPRTSGAQTGPRRESSVPPPEPAFAFVCDWA